MFFSCAVQLSVAPCRATELGLVCIQHAVMGRPLHLCCRLLTQRWATLEISRCAASPRWATLEISSCAASSCRRSCTPGSWWRACSLRLFRYVDINPNGIITVPAGPSMQPAGATIARTTATSARL